ncbi:Uma2 family endonuclease [Sorangium sp. So ce1504]|uniref:Uma2 family endonuclease n=1 Tax=Sorangium sp. So ce1504 TaxID=3133337 RepID=UPI003F623EB0
MPTAAQKPHPATVADLLAIPEEQRFHEILDGELVQKAVPSFEHGDAQSAIVAHVKIPFQRRPGGRWPGGWWFATEIEVEFMPDQVYRPDVVGWRRERAPERPSGCPVRLRPDWVCEVLSPSNARNDTVKKMRVYQRCQLPHYWIVDPREETLTVHRWTSEGYLVALRAERGERIRAEPFDAIELQVGVLFGDEREDD